MSDSKEQAPSSDTGSSSQTLAESTTAKSKNADKNEAKRQAKLAKFAAKQAKLTATGNVSGIYRFLNYYTLQITNHFI